MAIGDQLNDLEMVAAVGHGVAMTNAPAALKREARYVAPSVFEQGAAEVIEAMVLAATEPVHPTVMAQLIEIPVDEVDELCAALASEYADQDRGFALVRVAGGWRFQTAAAAYAYVERFVLEGQTARL